MLEAGAPAKMRDLRKWYDHVMQGTDPLGAALSPDEYVNSGADYSLRQRAIYAAGGSTLHWIGRTPRMKPEDFEFQTRCGYGLDWPFGYEHLEPYYERAESTLQVCGEASDRGLPPRSAPFPLPPMPYARSDDRFLDAMDRLGFSYNHAELARNSKTIHGQTQCQTIGTCGYCPIGGRFTGDQPLARLAADPNFELQTQCSVQRLRLDANGVARAIEYLANVGGEWVPQVLEADTFVIAAGGLESSAILQASIGAGPSQLSEHLGQNLFVHFEAYVRAPASSNDEFLAGETSFATAASRHFDSAEEQTTGKFRMSHFAEDRLHATNQMLVGESASSLRERLGGRVYHSLLGEIEQRPRDLGSVRRSSGQTRFGLPKLEIDYRYTAEDRKAFARFEHVARQILGEMGCDVWPLKKFPVRPTAHPMGTCRMAEAPEHGVVDANLQVHGTTNVYASGSSVFPTGGSANPTITLVALAHRLGDHLVESS